MKTTKLFPLKVYPVFIVTHSILGLKADGKGGDDYLQWIREATSIFTVELQWLEH